MTPSDCTMNPTMRWLVSRGAAHASAVSPSQMGRFETKWLSLVHSGDRIRLTVRVCQLDLMLSDKELARRQQS